MTTHKKPVRHIVKVYKRKTEKGSTVVRTHLRGKVTKVSKTKTAMSAIVSTSTFDKIHCYAKTKDRVEGGFGSFTFELENKFHRFTIKGTWDDLVTGGPMYEITTVTGEGKFDTGKKQDKNVDVSKVPYATEWKTVKVPVYDYKKSKVDEIVKTKVKDAILESLESEKGPYWKAYEKAREYEY